LLFVSSFWNRTISKFNIVVVKIYIGVEILSGENTKITLPKEIQKQMIEFFLKTSIPRLKQKKQRLLSENKSGGGEKND